MFDATELKIVMMYVAMQNLREQFEECWDEIASKAGVNREKHVVTGLGKLSLGARRYQNNPRSTSIGFLPHEPSRQPARSSGRHGYLLWRLVRDAESVPDPITFARYFRGAEESLRPGVLPIVRLDSVSLQVGEQRGSARLCRS